MARRYIIASSQLPPSAMGTLPSPQPRGRHAQPPSRSRSHAMATRLFFPPLHSILASSPPTLLPSYPPTLLPSFPPHLHASSPPLLRVGRRSTFCCLSHFSATSSPPSACSAPSCKRRKSTTPHLTLHTCPRGHCSQRALLLKGTALESRAHLHPPLHSTNSLASLRHVFVPQVLRGAPPYA